MSTKELYDGIFEKYKNFLMDGEIITDGYLQNGVEDKRLGISLIIPVNIDRAKISPLIEGLRSIESNQYYQPFEDYHITIFDFVKGSENYRYDNVIADKIVNVCNSVIRNMKTFEIKLEGIVFSNEAGIIKGYDGNKLINIRNEIRTMMVKLGIRNDERYQSQSAHISFCRFRSDLNNPKGLMDFIDKNREDDLGMIEVHEIELVEHDWYNSKMKKRIIQRYRI